MTLLEAFRQIAGRSARVAKFVAAYDNAKAGSRARSSAWLALRSLAANTHDVQQALVALVDLGLDPKLVPTRVNTRLAYQPGSSAGGHLPNDHEWRLRD